MKRLGFVILCLSLCLAAKAQQIVFTPQWTAQAQFAGYYVAQAKGFYKEAGLDVVIRHPSASNSCVNRLRSGESQYITQHLVSAMTLIDEGLPLVNILQTSQVNSQMIVSREPLEGPESLKGKYVGRWKSGFFELAQVMDRQYKLDIKWVPFVQNVNLFISGAIDAVMAMNYNEYYQLLMAGQRPDKSQLLYFSEIGYNVPEDGVYVTADYYLTHRDEVRKFAEASRKGWEWAAEHEEEALDIVMQAVQADEVGTNRLLQRWMLRDIMDMQKDKKTGRRTYRLEPSDLELANRLMKYGGLLRNEVTYRQITQP